MRINFHENATHYPPEGKPKLEKNIILFPLTCNSSQLKCSFHKVLNTSLAWKVITFKSLMCATQSASQQARAVIFASPNSWRMQRIPPRDLCVSVVVGGPSKGKKMYVKRLVLSKRFPFLGLNCVPLSGQEVRSRIVLPLCPKCNLSIF